MSRTVMLYGAPNPRQKDSFSEDFLERIKKGNVDVGQAVADMVDEAGGVVKVDGDAIRAAREELGWTLRRLARALGISAPYWSDVEHGRRGLTAPRIEQLTAILGIDASKVRPRCSKCGQPVPIEKNEGDDEG